MNGPTQGGRRARTDDGADEGARVVHTRPQPVSRRKATRFSRDARLSRDARRRPAAPTAGRLAWRLLGAGLRILALVLALVLPLPALAAPYQLTSADGGYSITFPAGPQEQVNEDANARTVLNALNYDNGYYAVVHVDNKLDLKLNDELEGNINKFTEQFHAPTQLRRKKKVVRAPGEELPAEEFTFESDELVGKGIVIVAGRRTYMIAAFGLKPHDRKAAVDRFVKSFKFKIAAPIGKPPSKARSKPEDAALNPK
jgi:hypothetical protein